MKPIAKKSNTRLRASIEQRRRRNMRQLLLGASRIVQHHVVEAMNVQGYATLRDSHSLLLSGIEFAGSTIAEAAQRAGITPQTAAGIAIELETLGYITVKTDPEDAWASVLKFTKTGNMMMLDGLEMMAILERRYAYSMGEDRLETMLESLATFIEQEEKMAASEAAE
jgi:DNA-binding MarR family transcriptional regulator